MATYNELQEALRAEFPDFKIVRKADSHFMACIDAVLRLITFGMMKTFMTDFTTTIGETIYISDRFDTMDELGKSAVLRHERVHMRQKKRYGMVLYAMLYLFVLPTVFAFYRKKFEQEAYKETMLTYAEAFGPDCLLSKNIKEMVIEQFTSAAYFWTWPFRASIERWYLETVDEIYQRLS